jgi:hypothetical protein
VAPGTAGYKGVLYTETFTARWFRIDGVTDWGNPDNFNGGLSEIRFNQADVVVPEPATFLLAAVGLAGLGVVAWGRRRKIVDC